MLMHLHNSNQKILEVSIPEQAVPSLVMRSGHKLAQIGEVKSPYLSRSPSILSYVDLFVSNNYVEQMSGAKLILIEGRTEQPGKIVQISGSSEQAERAQSLLQGFILSSEFFSCIFILR